MHDKIRRGAAGLAALLLAAPVPGRWRRRQVGAGKVVDPARDWDHLWNEVIVDITIIGILFAIVTAWFIWQARRRPGNEVGASPKLSPASAVGWVVIPIFVFLSIDLYTAANGWVLWNTFRDVPANRLEIKLEAGMYSWDYTYPNGVRTQNELVVPAGTPVVLRMTSRDTLHSHYIPDFRVKEDSMPGRITYLWFNPDQAGRASGHLRRVLRRNARLHGRAHHRQGTRGIRRLDEGRGNQPRRRHCPRRGTGDRHQTRQAGGEKDLKQGRRR
jgi:heme/copper-type cytochrome/quinol oxidase subunit 2